MKDVKNQSLPERSEIPEAYRWKISDLFESDEAFENELTAFNKDMTAVSGFQGRLGEAPETLLAYEETKEALMIRLDTLYAYAMQRSDEDTGNAVYQDKLARTTQALNRFYSLLSFEEPELLALPEDYIPAALTSEAGLAPFRHSLEDVLRMKPHTLSAEGEALMALTMDMDQSPRNIYSMFNNADIRFEDAEDGSGQPVSISHGNFVPLLESSDRTLRENVFKSFYKSYDHYKNTVSAIYAANLKKELFNTRARRYASTMEAHLAGNNIPVSVYDGLIEAVHQALPQMYRYVSLRKRMLEVDELHMYDVYTPLVADADRHYSFDEAKAMVLQGLAPLGPDYLQVLKDGMESGWIDICENKGKRPGAYSGGDYAHHPYVLMNFQGNLDNVFTLAHEMGHSLHSWLANSHNNYTNACYSIFVAEIASTTNEALLMQDLLSRCKDRKEKLYLLNHYLDQFKGTLFRQTMFAEFEKITHQMAADGETLNARTLCDIYLELNKKYFGPEMVSDPEIALEWARIPHFYSPFYVYQYATGFSAATAFSRAILTEGQPAVERYLHFLSEGGSDYPIEVLKRAGVDMTTGEPVTNALAVFADILDQMEALLDEN